MTSRRSAASLAMFLCIAVIASTIFFALRADGREGTETTTNDGGAWLVNQRAGSIGHLNRQVKELSSAVRIGEASASIEVYQPLDTVVAHDRSTNSLTVLDQRTHQLLNTVRIPGDATVLRHDNGLIIASETDDQIWNLGSVALAEVQNLDSITPSHQGAIDAIATDDTGMLLVAQGSTLLRITSELTDAIALPDGIGSVDDIVLDGEIIVLRAGNQLVRVEGLEARVLGSTTAPWAVAGQGSPVASGTIAAIDISNNVLQISTATGAATTLGTLDGSGPVPPIEHAGCTYALINRPAQYWVSCGGGAPTVIDLAGAGNRDLRLRLVNGWVWINDLISGNLWTVDEEQRLSLIDDWGAVLPLDAAEDQEDTGSSDAEDDLIEEVENPDAEDAETIEADEFDEDGINQPPVAVDDNDHETHQGRPLVIHVVGNDEDPDNDVLLVSSVESLAGGDADIRATVDGSSIQITPAPEFVGTLRFVYTITDGRGGSDSASGTVVVAQRDGSDNQPPVAVTDVAAITAGERGIIDVLLNDTDPDGDSLVVVEATAPQGTISFDPAGRVIYEASTTSEEGEVELSYVIEDDFGERDTGTIRVSIRLKDSNQPPDARNDGAVTVVSQPVTVNLLNNDTDPDGDDLFVAQRPVLLSPTGIEVFTTITPDGEFVFIPDEAGTYVFSYAASDDEDSDVAQIRIEVSEATRNRPPVAVRDDAVIPLGESRIVYALQNDGDPDGDVVGIVDLNVPPNSGLRVEQFLDLGFRVTVDGSGPARRTFTYSISDGIAEPVTASVVIAIADPETENQPPLAQADTVEIRPGTSVIVPVLDNDFDPEGGALRVVGVSTIGGATAEVGPGQQSVRISVEPTTTTSFSVSYDVIDDVGNRTAAIVRVRVVPNGEPNRPPVARPDSARAPFETEISIRVVDNDTDPDGDALRVESIATQPANGIAIVDPSTGQVRYQPADGYSGTDRFTYTVVDAFGARTPGEVLIGVMPEPERNRDPVAVDDSFITVATGERLELDVLRNDSDPDGDQVRIINFDQPALGTVDRPLDRSVISYTAPAEQATDETITFEYTIGDARGGRATATVTVLVQATPPLPAGTPIAVDDVYGPVLAGTEFRMDVVDNDRDPDGPVSELTVSVFDERLTVDGQTIVLIVPDESLTLTYEITDIDGNTSSAVVELSVIAPKPPIAVDDQAGPYLPGEQFWVDVLANDLDDDGDPSELELVSVDGPGAIIDDGEVRIVAPDASTQFTYTIVDPTGLEASATISVIVTENRAPLVEPGAFETAFEEPIELDLAPLAVDPDGDALFFSCCDSTRGGAPQVLDAGEDLLRVEFTPDADFSGDAVFTFTVDDQAGNIVAGSVTVTVTEQPNRPPVAIEGTAELQKPRAEGAPITTTVDVAALTIDPDPDDTFTWTIEAQPDNGLEARLLGDGLLEIVATDQSEVGETTLVWGVTDAEGDTATATMSITVLEPENDPPEASSQSLDVPAGNTTTLNLAELTFDDDANEVLEWEIVATPPTGITVIQTGTSEVTIAAAINASNESTTFDYTVTDRLGETANALVTITVGLPDYPLLDAVDDTAETLQEQSVTIPVLANDSDPIGQGLTIVDPGSSLDGAVTANGDTIDFLPNPTFFGSTTFSYTIRDANDTAEREDRATVTIDVTGRPDAPNPPECTPESRIANLTWTTPADNGAPITGYEFSAQGLPDVWTFTPGAVASSTQLTDLENGRSYAFRIRAENIAGWGDWSDYALACTPDIEPERPAPPQVTHGDGWLEVTWTEPANDGSDITEYEVRIGGGSVQTSTDTFLRWTGLENGTDYTFQVAARNAKGLGEFSTASTPEHPSTTPAAPVIQPTTRASLVGAQASGILEINWTPVPVSQDGGDTIIEYRIERSDGATAIAPGANTGSYVWSGLPNGTSFEFRVFAVNRDGDSDPSGWSPTLQACTVPAAPPTVSSAPGDTEAQVTWIIPTDDGGCAITDYEVRISGETQTTTTPATPNFMTMTGLTNGDPYAFEVRANNVLGGSTWTQSNSVTPRGLPICGGGFQLNTIDLSGARLSWNAANANGAPGLAYELNTNSGGWQNIGSATQHTLSLASDTSYTVRIRATNLLGPSVEECGTVSFQSCPSAPPAPGKPTLTANVASLTINGSWDSVTIGCTSQPQVTSDYDLDRYEIHVEGSITGTLYNGGIGLANGYGASSMTPGDSVRLRVRSCYASVCGAWSPWSDPAEFPAPGTVSISQGSPDTYNPSWTTGAGHPCYPAQAILNLGADPNQGCYYVNITLSGWDSPQSVHCYRTTNNDEAPWNGTWAYYGGHTLGNGTHAVCSYTQAGRAVAVVVNGSLSGQLNRVLIVPSPAVVSNMIDPWPTN